MNSRHRALWIGAYWLLYLPTSLVLKMFYGGSWTGIFVIGGVLSLILFVFLMTQGEIHAEVYEHGKKQRQESRAQNSTRPEVGFEPGVPMRTDVNLGSLDADGDGDFGTSASNAAK